MHKHRGYGELLAAGRDTAIQTGRAFCDTCSRDQGEGALNNL